MTVIHIKNVFVGVAAVVALVSPMFVMADAFIDGLQADINAAQAALDVATAAYNDALKNADADGSGTISPAEQTRVDALGVAVEEARAKLNKAKDALANAEKARTAAAKKAKETVGGGVSGGYDITKNPAELEVIGGLLVAGKITGDPVANLDECKKAAARLAAGIKDGQDAGSIQKLKDAELKCLNDLRVAIGKVSRGNSNAANAVVKVTTKISNLTKWQYVTLAPAKEPALQFSVKLSANGKSAQYSAQNVPSSWLPFQMKYSYNGKNVVSVPFAKGNCKNASMVAGTKTSESKLVSCTIARGVSSAVAKALKASGSWTITSKGKEIGRIQWNNGKQAAEADVTAKIAALLAREKEACDIILHRFTQFNTAVSEGNGALSTSDARAELRKLLDAAVAACGTSNLADEKKALEKVLADLKGLMGERIGKSPTSGGVPAISLSDDPNGAKGILIGLFAAIQDKFTIIADLMNSGVIDTKLSASAAPATPSTPTSQPTQPQAPATGGGAEVTCPTTETTGDTKRCTAEGNIQYCYMGQWQSSPTGSSICSPNGSQGAYCNDIGAVVHATCNSNEVCRVGRCTLRSASAPSNLFLGSLLKAFGR